MTVSEFQFVNQHAPQAHKDRDPITKHLIRKKAARAAAVTKKQEIVSSQSRLAKTTPQHAPIPAFLIHPSADATAFLPSPALQDALLSRLRPQLKHPHVRLSKILRLCGPEFAALVHDNTGHVPYLDDAIASLQARIRDSVGAAAATTTTPADGATMQLYARAVSRLQCALKTPLSCHMETWLAAICLTLFELLDLAADNPTWMLHSKGAFCVVAHIGPDNLVSEAHKVMLTATAPAIATEMLHSGVRCVLGEPKWQAAVRRCRVPTTSPLHGRGALVLSLQALRYRLPTLFADVTDIVVHKVPSMDVTAVSQDLAALCKDIQACLAKWASELHTPLKAAKADTDRLCMLEMGLSCAAVALRLLSALRPHEADLEDSAVEIARRALAQQPPPAFASERTYHRGIASSVVATRRVWQEALRFASSSSKDRDVDVIGADAFRTWSTALGRPV